MKHIKLCAYVLCGMSLVCAHGVAAQEEDSCEQRASELRQLFAGRYLELDAKCGRVGPCFGTPDLQPPSDQPSDSPVVTSPDRIEGGNDTSGDDPSDGDKIGICGFPNSPECDAGYEALASEEAADWDSLYAECPELAKPIPVEGIGNGDIKDGVDNIGPLFRAPTSSELLKRVKTLEKKLRRAKKAARRGKIRRCIAR